MGKVHNKELSNYLKEFNKVLKAIDNAKNSYYHNTQHCVASFIKNFDKVLSYNTTPLKDLLKVMRATDRQSVVDYIKQATNVVRLSIDKDNNIVFSVAKDETYTVNESFIDSHNWYEKELEKDKKAIVFDDNKLKATLQAIIKKLDKESTETFNNAITNVSAKKAMLQAVVNKL